jgi:DNA (cytosine-5)-methyltransferase 1
VLNELALFAGAGGGILAGKLIGFETICAVEINDFCRQRLFQRQNEGHLASFPIWDDICTFDGKCWRGAIDVVSGGFPCQAFSTATHGRATARDFWPEMLRVIREVRPRFVFAENVSGKAIKKAAEDCQQIGYKTETIALSAQDLGADHIRKRHWVVAYADMHDELFRQKHAASSVLQNIRHSVWETYPDESRVADGMAHRMDRFRAIGNGQVPIVAATAWRLLIERISGRLT